MKSLRRTLTPLRAWLLALVLVAAQSAGMAHRIVHGAPQAGAGAKSAWGLDHKQGTADCRLLDQLTHADALCGPAVAELPALPPVATRDVALSLPLQAAAPAPYLARAPPASQRT